MALRFLIFFSYALIINAFNPLSISLLSSSDSATHESITRCAFATITSEYIKTRYGIQITVPTITNGICPSSFFSQIKDAFSQIQKQGGNKYCYWEDTLDYIVGRNALVDVTEQTDESRHFDSESFVAASQIILNRYQLAVQALNSLDYENSNEYFGKMLHTLQDFYSHSNWIELNQRQPQPDLGIKTMASSQFAGPTVRTCSNCADYNGVCQSNNDITKGLTSGYFILLADIVKKKPVGKCSHGGSADATRNNDAKGGINKDTLTSIHGYLHIPAAQTAYLASCKVLRQFRSQVLDTRFGLFLNILNRHSTSSRTLSVTKIQTSINDSKLVYTNILNQIRQAKSFSSIQQLVRQPANDSYYKAHILSIAHQKHITIDILRNSVLRKNSYDFGQDLARLTGGLYLVHYNQSQELFKSNSNEQMELIDFLYSKQLSNDISINIDTTCSNLLLEFITNETISTVKIQLKNTNQLISPSSIETNTTYFKSYLFNNISAGNWKLILTSTKQFSFILRVSCSSEFRCFSRTYVDNKNSIHPGAVELEGNLIQNRDVILITTCDNNGIRITNMSVMMIDEFNGKIIRNSIPSTYDSINDRWITNLTQIPSKSFRLKYLINNQAIQRLSRLVYQSSLIDVEILNVNTTIKTQTIVQYRLYNYQSKSIRINFLAKDIGSYMATKNYVLKANEARNDQIQFDQNSRAANLTNNILALTVKASETDWNYDVITI